VERYSIAIRDLPTEERPRERLEKYGADALATAELLAILIRTGTPQESAVGLAERLLSEFGSLRAVAMASVSELSGVRGIGRVKAIQIAAAVELGRRLAAFSEEDRPRIRGPADVARLLMPELRDAPQEEFRVLLLNTQNEVLRTHTITVGLLNESPVHPRELFRAAVRNNAHAVIAVHNHPSGDPTPSKQDIAVTRRLRQAGELMGIELLDHIVLGDGRWVSLKERDLL